MDWLEAAFAGVSGTRTVETMERFRASIDPAWIEEALSETGTATVRRRRLPAEEIVWLVIGMALQRNYSIAEVASRLDLVMPSGKQERELARSSIAEARQRLGEEPIRWLFEHTARRWAVQSAEARPWRGLAVFAADGTTLRIADSPENEEYFEKPASHFGDGGYPVVRANTLMAVRSHLLLDANFGPYRMAELVLAEDLWPSLPSRSLTILDKLYDCASVLRKISEGGSERHWLVLPKKVRKWKVLRSLGRNEQLVEIATTSKSREQDPSLPETFQARAIRGQLPKAREPQWFLTSLLDPKAYPARELIALYHERWEIELGYDEIKTHLLEREETLRSRTVEGVHQEIWGIFLAYNLVRLEMERIADEAGVAPSRLSFLTALRVIREEWHWLIITSPGALPKRLKTLRAAARFVLPERRDRSYPRGVKVWGSRHPPISRARRGLK